MDASREGGQLRKWGLEMSRVVKYIIPIANTGRSATRLLAEQAIRRLNRRAAVPAPIAVYLEIRPSPSSQ
jgi:hypothetical protein